MMYWWRSKRDAEIAAKDGDAALANALAAMIAAGT